MRPRWQQIDFSGARHERRDQAYPQSRVSRRWTGDALSSGNEGRTEGNADGRRPAGAAARRRRSARRRYRALHLRHRAQQSRDRRSLRQSVRTRSDAGVAEQDERARGSGARSSRCRADELYAPASAARTRPRGLVRARDRRQRTVRFAASRHDPSRPDVVSRGHDRGLQQAWRQSRRRRAGARGSDASVRDRRREGREGRSFHDYRNGREAEARNGAVQSSHHGTLHSAARHFLAA